MCAQRPTYTYKSEMSQYWVLCVNINRGSNIYSGTGVYQDMYVLHTIYCLYVRVSWMPGVFPKL